MLDKLSDTDRTNPMSAGHGRVTDVLAAVDHALENGPYLLGETFSAADVVFGSTLNFALMFGVFDKTDLRAAYVERLMSRPAAQKAAELNLAYAKQFGWD